MSFWDSLRGGVNSLPLVGGLTSAIWGDPAQEDKQKALKEAAARMKAYRLTNNQARMNAMNMGAQAFAPINNLMGQMYGQGSVIDTAAMTNNPFTQQAQNQMYVDAFGSAPPPGAPPGPNNPQGFHPQQVPGAQFNPNPFGQAPNRGRR